MLMHDAFADLFPAIVKKDVAGVSGVSNEKSIEIAKGSSATPKCNTLEEEQAKGVSPATPETPPRARWCTSVSRKSEETQQDDTNETPATPETPQKHYTRADFEKHKDKLCTMPRISIYSAARWQQIQADAKAFFDLWGAQVAALGWNPENVFAIPDGLIPLIEGGDILAVCEKTAVVRSRSGKQFNTIRFKALSGEAAPNWRVWASLCEP